VTVLIDPQRIWQDELAENREVLQELGVRIGFAVWCSRWPGEVVRILPRIEAEVRCAARSIATRPWELGAEQCANRIAFLYKIAVTWVAPAYLQRRRPAQLGDECPHPRGVREELQGEVAGVDRQDRGYDVVTAGLDLTNIRQLQVGKAAGGCILADVEGIPSAAAPIGDVQGGPVVQRAHFCPELPLGTHFGFEIGISKIIRCNTGTHLRTQRRKGREF